MVEFVHDDEANQDVLVILTGDNSGVCYLAQGDLVMQVASLHVHPPEHTDATQPTHPAIEAALLSERFPSYAAAVLTAVCNGKDIDRMFLCGDRREVKHIVAAMPAHLRKRCRTIANRQTARPLGRLREILRIVTGGRVHTQLLPFSS